MCRLQALILVGGEGTRLRPLTSDLPKPVVPLAGQPFMYYMVQWLRSHGVDDVVLSCGFLADGVREVLGDGSQLGIRLRYVEEPQPLGTGGALKYAEDLLDERFLMLNGDVLTDVDLTAQIAAHERTGARGTLALMAVEDPSAYGLVRLREDGSISEFLEKPGPEQFLDTNLVNAGIYILQRDVLGDMAAAGTNISIERDVFPMLVDGGLYGYEVDGYWLDIGTPDRYLQATFDILEGNVRTDVGAKLSEHGMRMIDPSAVHGRVGAPAIVGAGCAISTQAIVGGRTVLGNGVRIDEWARVESSVLFDGVHIGARTTVHGSIVAAGSEIGEHCSIDGGVVVGAGVRLGAENVLRAGARIFPGVQLPDGAIKF